MFCFNCGKELMNGANFCDNCGQAIWGRTSTYNGRSSFNSSQKDMKSNRLLSDYSDRITINAIIWLVIGIGQLFTSGILILFVSMFDISAWFVLILGISNVCSGISTINSKKEILEKPVGIVEKHKIDSGLFVDYVWNAVVGILCFLTGSYFFFLLAFMAIATDFFLVKLYVISHKQEFLELEEKHSVEEEDKHVLF